RGSRLEARGQGQNRTVTSSYRLCYLPHSFCVAASLHQLADRFAIVAQCWFRPLNEEVVMTKAKKPIPEGYHTVTPQLTLENTEQAIEWYKKALGAEEVSRAAGPDGKIMHAEIRVGNSRLMLNDEMGGGKSARAMGGSPMSL